MYDSSPCLHVYNAGQPAPRGGEKIAKLESELGCNFTGVVTICLKVVHRGPSTPESCRYKQGKRSVWCEMVNT